MILPTMVIAFLSVGCFQHRASGFAPPKCTPVMTHRPAPDHRWSRKATDIDGAEAAALELDAGEDEPETLEVDVGTKPLGMVLESNSEGVAAGVFCCEVPKDGAAYKAGVRSGDLVVAIQAMDAASWTLDQALAAMAAAEAPVALTLERYPDAGFMLEEQAISDAEKERELRRLLAGKGSSKGSKVQMAPRRLPSAKKLARASTNIKFWQDPLMIGSAVFTVAAPLAVLLAAQH